VVTQLNSTPALALLSSSLESYRQAWFYFSAAKYGLDEPPPEVAAMISHATEERLKTLLEKLSVIAEHRLDVIKVNNCHMSQLNSAGGCKRSTYNTLYCEI
jgi:transcription initiation factor TFIID subunit 4